MEDDIADQDLFAAARALPESERHAYLLQACPESTRRAAVQSLLDAAARADAFFNEPDDTFSPPYSATPATPTEKEGDQIGPYTLRQKIGEGGFGTVWMADQSGALNRTVALKVVKAGMDTAQVLARFEAERQALARMDHPNIARVLDAGATPTGRPYFVMEFVKGAPITTFCNETNLDTNARLALFQDTCSAVNHAHQKGIIHRDLKPSNVLVTLADGRPVAKIIDFGIAKATEPDLTDATLFTRFGQFLGTPAYMSPEQAALSGTDVDTRSDIYSLGVLLYELLAGTPPFDPKTLLSAGYDEMRRIIREDEPPKPSTKSTRSVKTAPAASTLRTPHSKFPTELDWIVMKAIDKDRSRRYETADAFASDIARHLSGEPVQAAPPSTAYRCRKFVQRHRATITVATFLVAVLVAATAVSTYQAVRATRAEKQTALALADSEAMADFLAGVFQTPDPSRDGDAITVAELLEAAAARIDTDLAGQPSRQAKFRRALAETFFRFGLYDQVIDLREKLRDHSIATAGLHDLETLDIIGSLGTAYAYAGRLDDALALQEQVLALRRSAAGSDHEQTLVAITSLALTYQSEGRHQEAHQLHQEVLDRTNTIHGPEHWLTARAMTWVALSRRHGGDLQQAIPQLVKAWQLARRTGGPTERHTLWTMHNLAESYRQNGDAEKALDLFEQEVALRREAMGSDERDTLVAILSLADAYRVAGRTGDALKLREEVVDTRTVTLGPGYQSTLAAMAGLARAYLDAGRQQDAIDTWRRSLEIDPSQPTTQLALGSALAELQRFPEALPALETARALTAQGTLAITTRNTLANTLDALGESARAETVRAEIARLPRPLDATAPDPVATLVPPTAPWRWLHPTDGIDPATAVPDFHTTFPSTGFDESSWNTANDSDTTDGGFGYGDPSAVDIGTPPPGDRHTAYFRHRFTTTRPHANIELRCQIDDGIIVYIDGQQVTRNNMPDAENTWRTHATRSVNAKAETTVQRHPLPGFSLPPGDHVLAISLHNADATSPDLRIAGITLVELPSP